MHICAKVVCGCAEVAELLHKPFVFISTPRMAYSQRWRTRRYGRSRYRRRRRLRATISRPVPPMAIGYHVESPRTAVRYVSFVYHNRFDAPVYNNPTFDVVGVRCAECFDPVFASTPVSTSPADLQPCPSSGTSTACCKPESGSQSDPVPSRCQRPTLSQGSTCSM